MHNIEYLPVKGEPKEGDMILTIAGYLKRMRFDDLTPYEAPVLCKPFLCETGTINKIKELPDNFITRCYCEVETSDKIDDYIDYWHDEYEGKDELYEFLGMSYQEYQLFVNKEWSLESIIKTPYWENYYQNI